MKDFIGGVLVGVAVMLVGVFSGAVCYCTCCDHHAACQTECKPCVCPSPAVKPIGAAAPE